MNPAWAVYATVATVAATALYFANRRQLRELDLLNAESDRLMKIIEAWAPYIEDYAETMEGRARQAVSN